jgi:uncharacterized membrane protein
MVNKTMIMKNRNKMIYWIATGLLTANMLFSAGMYIFKHEMVIGMFEALSYPAYIIYPLAIAKILGLIAIWSNKSKTLKEWAYAGFVFELLLAASAHINVSDGGEFAAIIVLVLTLLSYTFYRIEETKPQEV